MTTKPDEPALRSSGNARSTSARARPKSTGSRFCQPSPSTTQRDLFDRLRRMRDPAPTENALAVGHEAVDSELKLPLFVIAHRCIGKVGPAARILREEDGLRGRWRAGR